MLNLNTHVTSDTQSSASKSLMCKIIPKHHFTVIPQQANTSIKFVTDFSMLDSESVANESSSDKSAQPRPRVSVRAI